MQIGEVCSREVVYCDRGASVVEVAKLMRNHHVGDLIVAESRDGTLVPVGVVTDRDLVVKVLAEAVSAEVLTAGDLMTRHLVTVDESDSVYEAIRRMRDEGIRRLPVLGANGALVGVLSADDVTELLAEELGTLARIAPRQSVLEKKALPPLKE
jgi:CBS domain-containing protein